jgi:hypothetical protein
MSGTQATISILKSDKTIETIFTNYDGGLLQTGKILNNCYTDAVLVKTLISKGNVSGVHANENLSNKNAALNFLTKKDYWEKVQCFDYNYLFKEDEKTWCIVKNNKIQNLTEVLAKAEEKIFNKKIKV